MACGVAMARFVFTTSNLPEYTETVAADMQLKITTALGDGSTFVQMDTCENVVDTTGDFPSMIGCRFTEREARFILGTRLLGDKTYSITIRLLNPAQRVIAAQNSFDMTVEYYQMKVIEGTRFSVDMTHTIENAKDFAKWGTTFSVTPGAPPPRGYVTAVSWQPPPGALPDGYSSAVNARAIFQFGIRTFGSMTNNEQGYHFLFIAHPTNVWQLGVPAADCDDADSNLQGVTCKYDVVSGSTAAHANAVRWSVGTTTLDNLQTALGEPPFYYLKFRGTNPPVGVNSYWTVTSYKQTTDQLPVEPFTVFVDKTITTLGQPEGWLCTVSDASINAENWVTLEFTPGNTVLPLPVLDGVAGRIVIIPPAAFTVIDSAEPRPDLPIYNALPCTLWPEAPRRLHNRWDCYLGHKAIFRETTYRVKLQVRNAPQPQAAFSWRVEVWQIGMTKPVAISRKIRGMAVTGTMIASVAPTNQLLGVLNILSFEFTPSQDIGNMTSSRLEVTAPPGFFVRKRCSEFQPVSLPRARCKGSDSNTFELTFPERQALNQGTKYTFVIQFRNPYVNVNSAVNVWRFRTIRPDGIAKDTANYNGFFLFPNEFSSFVVSPMNRNIGPQLVTVRFISKNDVPFDDYIRIRAPATVVWHSTSLAFKTDTATTEAAQTLFTRAPDVPLGGENQLIMQLTQTALANFEYGVQATCVVPPATPAPNRWWIEQYRQTGLAPPDEWQYVSSFGAVGYKTQVLVNARVDPFNIVEDAWENPTLVEFETTKEIKTGYIRSQNTDAVRIDPQAELYLEAPPRFTFICPLSETVFMPPLAQKLPADAVCVVDHENPANRNKLHIYFSTGLEANTRYAFTIYLVNAAYVNPTMNEFQLSTKLNNVVVEAVVLPGFMLAKRMDNTRYVPGVLLLEDKRVGATRNRVSFILGTEQTVSTGFGQTSMLMVKAPPSYEFPFDCTNTVGSVPSLASYKTLPTISMCQSMERENPPFKNIIRIYMTTPWEVGNYAMFTDVINPPYTPDRNFWGFTIFDHTDSPAMSESWVAGFETQVVLAETIPVCDAEGVCTPVIKFGMLTPTNQGNFIPGASALNTMDVSFVLTTRLPTLSAMDVEIGAQLRLIAPPGFIFPPVCQNFAVHTEIQNTFPLPPATTCNYPGPGDPSTIVIRIPQMYHLDRGTRYSFRVLVENGAEVFLDGTASNRTWAFETRRARGNTEDRIDYNGNVPSFPVYSRMRYLDVDTTSQVGKATTMLRVLFSLFDQVAPQKQLVFKPPTGTVFGNPPGTLCFDESPLKLALNFEVPEIMGRTRLPPYMLCNISSPTEALLTNINSVLGGRPLNEGPVYEFFVKNVTNSQRTPELNFFRMTAETTSKTGKEDWISDGYVVYPELTSASVTSSNQGFGLHTTFAFALQVVTALPSFGSFLIQAPAEYYFGPRIDMGDGLLYSLDVSPPAQGRSPMRPSTDQPIACVIERSVPWSCAPPLYFRQCQIRDELNAKLAMGALSAAEETMRTDMILECTTVQEICYTGDLSTQLACKSRGSTLEVTLLQNVVLLAGENFKFNVEGYNTDSTVVEPWNVTTRNSDSIKTVLDDKPGVPGIFLHGIIYVDSLVPESSMVSVMTNYIKITLRLTTTVQPRARLEIVHPLALLKPANAALEAIPITTGVNFPLQLEKRQIQRMTQIESFEEAFLANVALEVTIGVYNPEISPIQTLNVWTFQTYTISGVNGKPELVDINNDVWGFKIYGEFQTAAVNAAVLSPTVENIVGVWIMLNSRLKYTTPRPIMKLYMPKGFEPLPRCDGFTYVHNLNREVKNPFPRGRTYIPMESGTDCDRVFDVRAQAWYLELTMGAELPYGQDYTFEFKVKNAGATPVPNVWRFETWVQGVILHLKENIPGFDLEEIKEVGVRPADTTKLQSLNRVEFYMMSDKAIPGGSKIRIMAPMGFAFSCIFFATDDGLSNTTTCIVLGTLKDIAEFTIDSADPKKPNSPFRLYVYLSNPEFTPLPNDWKFEIRGPLNQHIDVHNGCCGFDITGNIAATITAGFPFLDQINPLRVQFVISTILNQADPGNQLVITAPHGYFFPSNCTGFTLAHSHQPDAASLDELYPTYTFPPAGILCRGFRNATLVIEMPYGAGLLKNNYTMTVDVTNPGYYPNGTGEWSFITRVRNDAIGEKIVDSNIQLPGFTLRGLSPLVTLENAAPHRFSLCAWPSLSALILVLAIRF